MNENNKVQNDVMIQNIYSESKYFRMILDNKEEILNKFVPIFRDRDIRRIYLLGHGSTSYATIAIKYLFVKFLGIDTSHDVATIFNHYEGFNEKIAPENTLLICPAATGCTKGPVLAAREARKRGIFVLGSGEYDGNVLARECDVFINKLTGDENAYVDTKGHSATLFLYALCIISTAYQLGKLSKESYDEYMCELENIVNKHECLVNQCMNWYDAHQTIIHQARMIRIISYGINYATSVEAQLKVTESTQKDAIGYDLEQYLHGPNMSSKPEDVIFFVNPINGVEHDRMSLTYQLMSKENFTHLYMLGNPKDETVQSKADNIAFDFSLKEYLTYIQFVVFFQVLAGRMAIDLDLPTTQQAEAFVNVTSALETSFKE